MRDEKWAMWNEMVLNEIPSDWQVCPKILWAPRLSKPLHSATQGVDRIAGRKPCATCSPETKCGPRWHLHELPHQDNPKRCENHIPHPLGWRRDVDRKCLLEAVDPNRWQELYSQSTGRLWHHCHRFLSREKQSRAFWIPEWGRFNGRKNTKLARKVNQSPMFHGFVTSIHEISELGLLPSP